VNGGKEKEGKEGREESKKIYVLKLMLIT